MTDNFESFFFYCEEPRGHSKFSVNPDVADFVNKSKISSPVFSPLSIVNRF